MEYASAEDKARARHASDAGDGSPVRVGILGTAHIARTQVLGIAEVSGVVVDAIASRSLAKAQAFAKEYGILNAYGSYDEVIGDASIDVVYVPLPTSEHLEFVVKAARAKKHVLCEKPCALNAAELLVMLQACKEANVLFMDGIMFMHHIRLKQQLKEFAGPKFGAVGPTQAVSTFTFRADADFVEHNIRMDPALDGHFGALGDLGIYSIRLALCALAGPGLHRAPKRASGVVNNERKTVPLDVTGSLMWEADGLDLVDIPLVRTANFHCSFLHEAQQFAHVSGNKCTVSMDDFVIPRDKAGASWTAECKSQASNPTTETTGYCRQESNMWAAFRDLVLPGREAPEPDAFWPRIALLTQLCLDAVLESGRNHNGAPVEVDPDGLLAKFDAL